MAIVKKYKAKIVSINNVVDNIYTVAFTAVGSSFKYLPGQFLHLALEEYDPSAGWPESRCFSMQSAPKDILLKITFATKGNFTNRMALELTKGKIIDLKLPYGELFQQEHQKDKIVFIAGGTGITPYLSAFTDSFFQIYNKPKLYFGVRDMKYHIYQSELVVAQQINPSLEIFVKDQNIDGILDIDTIFNENGVDATYFISGPQAMISTFKNKLKTKGVSENNIRTDDWE
jgi:ferredoxin-NADP reductase